MRKIALLLAILTLFGCTSKQTEDNKKSKDPTILWTSDSRFVHPESVIYSQTHNCYFISNIGSDESEESPNGFISKVNLDGSIAELKFTDSIRSPKGLCIANEKLYVSALSHLLEIDLQSGQILNRYTNDEVVFLNDVTADDEGNVYVSGMRENKIYQLKDGVFQTYFASDVLEHPNGVFWHKDNIYIGGWGNMDEEDVVSDTISYLFKLLPNDELEKVTERMGKVDGIQKCGADLICSSWKSGEIFNVDENGKFELILQTEESAGDIYYNEESKLLIVPLNFQHKLIAYEL